MIRASICAARGGAPSHTFDHNWALGRAIQFLAMLVGSLPLIPQPLVAQVDTAWTQTYDGPAHGIEWVTAQILDDSQNVYVTGYSRGLDSTYDYATIKLSESGATLWAHRYEGSGVADDFPQSMAVDRSGNVYVTGQSGGGYESPTSDFATIKYSPAGDTLWIRRYDGPASASDGANDVAVDDSGNAFVTGVSAGVDSVSDCTTIKYTPSGDTLWVRRWDGGAFWGATGTSLALDDSGHIYVTGHMRDTSTDYDIILLKYSADGGLLWARSFDHPSTGGLDRDFAYSLALDNYDAVFVGGHSWAGTSYDFTTLKYSTAGSLQWVRHYNGTGNNHDQIHDLLVDSQGNVFVTGSSVGLGSSWDFATIKYSASGDTLWVHRLQSGSYPTAMAMDAYGNIYVTGQGHFYTSADFATVCYSPTGDSLWTRFYNGSGNDLDYAFDVAVDTGGNVYVSGWSEQGELDWDFATVKYAPCTSLFAGDLVRDETLTAADVIALVNIVFKGAGDASPCKLLGDVNCSATVTSADIIILVNHVFKGGPAPCDG